MNQKVVIKGRFFGEKTFPSLNNLLAAYAKKPIVGNAMKRKYQNICSWEIRSQLKGWKASKAVLIHYRFFEPSKGHKRDFINCYSFASKVFCDALQDCGVIPDDGPKWLLNETHTFFYTNDEPYIEIEIEEC